MKISLILLALTLIYTAMKSFRSISVSNLVISGVFAVMGWFAVRNISIYGFFALPAIAGNIQAALSKEALASNRFKTASLAVSFLVIIACFSLHLNSDYFSFYNFGIGQIPGEPAAAEFFEKENIKGPVFNNYDIGGYLIYYLYPAEKVFVDNRPEAYPKVFFENEYVPMQENNALFVEKEKQYKFNAILFSLYDLTSWGQGFLIQKVNDPEWAPVYVDNFAIIFVKRNASNRQIIQKYEIPKNRFSVSKR
jgi:hypothetical protein